MNEWGGYVKQPLHRNHFLIYCASTIFSIQPVVLYLLQSTAPCIMKSYHACLIPRNVYLSNEILIKLSDFRFSQRLVWRWQTSGI
jgi:hypothetical protein